MYRDSLQSVSGLQEDREVHESSIGIKSIDYQMKRKPLFLLRAFRKGNEAFRGGTNRCIREVTVILSIFFCIEYSKLIYQWSEHTICWLFHAKSCSFLSLLVPSKSVCFKCLQVSISFNTFKFSISSSYCSS